MSRKIVAIQANTSPARYVTATHKRFDGTFTVELTENENLAMDYGTREAAEKTIQKIFNPHERVFKAVQKTVIQPAAIRDFLSEYSNNARLS